MAKIMIYHENSNMCLPATIKQVLGPKYNDVFDS
jgi:hypothetical protein